MFCTLANNTVCFWYLDVFGLLSWGHLSIISSRPVYTSLLFCVSCVVVSIVMLHSLAFMCVSLVWHFKSKDDLYLKCALKLGWRGVIWHLQYTGCQSLWLNCISSDPRKKHTSCFKLFISTSVHISIIYKTLFSTMHITEINTHRF